MFWRGKYEEVEVMANSQCNISDVPECRGKKFSVTIESKEIARAFLYLIKNDLHESVYGLLEDVYVDKNYRGNGLGKEIVRNVISFAREAGCYKIIATSRTGREKVHKLYADLGFSEYGKEFRMNF